MIPELEHYCGSWVIVERGTLNSVCELFDRKNVERVNFAKYEALTTADYLGRLNRSLRSTDL